LGQRRSLLVLHLVEGKHAVARSAHKLRRSADWHSVDGPAALARDHRMPRRRRRLLELILRRRPHWIPCAKPEAQTVLITPIDRGKNEAAAAALELLARRSICREVIGGVADGAEDLQGARCLLNRELLRGRLLLLLLLPVRRCPGRGRLVELFLEF
jgi:hypothetical protein